MPASVQLVRYLDVAAALGMMTYNMDREMDWALCYRVADLLQTRDRWPEKDKGMWGKGVRRRAQNKTKATITVKRLS